MKIFLIYPNINVAKDTWYSFGLASLIAVLKQHGFGVKLRVMFSEDEIESVIKEIAHFQPTIVGFSSVASQFRFVRRVSERVRKEFPRKIIICGGVHPTIFPECLFDARSLDGVFRGECELAFPEFINRVRDKGDYKESPNYAYIGDDGKLRVNPTMPLIRSLDSLPFPDTESFDYEKIIKASGGRARFIFNRGCPNLCTFCSNHALAQVYNMPVVMPRYRSVELAIEEILRIKEKYEVKKVFIVDEIFGLNRDWFFKFCDLYEKQVTLPFECFQRANVVDEAKIKALKKAGCYSVDFGVESGNEYIRNKIMNRNMKRETLLKAFSLCRRYKLNTTAANIIGLPFETRDMIIDTVKINRELMPNKSIVGIFYPYPGTALERTCREKNLLRVDAMDDSNFVERKKGSIVKLEVSDDELEYFMHNWNKLVYRHWPTILRHPKVFLWDRVVKKLENKLRNWYGKRFANARTAINAVAR